MSEFPSELARTVRFVLTDGDGATSAAVTQTVNVTEVNDDPVITSNGGGATAAFNIAEGGEIATTVTVNDPDVPGQTIAYSISGGADVAAFSIDNATGELTFVNRPDFESPADANGDNVYEVTVRAFDGTVADSQDLTITIEDRRYIERNATFAASTANTWEVIDLSAGAFDIPADVAVEIGITTSNLSNQRFGGVREFGSTIDRRIDIDNIGASGEGTGYTVLTTQADAMSRIEVYSEDPASVTFTLLGYWESGQFVERYDTITLGTANTWVDQDLNSFGVGADQVAEIAVRNNVFASARQGGVRADGSTLERRIDMHPTGFGGEISSTFLVQASSAPTATVELFAENTGNIEFRLLGYWSEAPGTFNETFTDLGLPTASAIWEQLDLTGNGLSGNDVANIMFLNANTSETAAEFGVRTNESNTDRFNDIRHASTNGGVSSFSTHVNTDSTGNIEWYEEKVGGPHSVYLTGYWSSSAPVVALPGSALSFAEGDAAAVIDSTATVSDTDSFDFDTGTLTVDFTANGTANDRLAIRNEGTGAGQVGVSGSNVTYEGTTIGTFTGGTDGSTPLVITFNADSTPTAAQALARNITYENVATDPDTDARTVRFVLNDGDGETSAAVTQTVNLTGDNILVVNTTSDTADGTTTSIDALLADRGADGKISLREAIEATNNTANGASADEIHFEILDALIGGVHTISVGGSGLPTILEEVVIDGRTDADFSSDPVIVLDGNGVTGTVHGLTLTATSDGSIIRNLTINRFSGDGVQIQSGADNITIAGNWIGSDGTGSPLTGNGDDGIDIRGANATIGGLGANDGNVINNAADEGITIASTGTGTMIFGNIIGLESDGSSGTGNADVGIAVFADNTTIGGNTTAHRNVISNNFEGIEINTSNNTIQGNYIGTDAGGTLDRGNGSDDGIEIQSGGSNNVIGGRNTGEGNLIAFNGRDGVYIASGTGNTVTGNQIHSNSGLGIDLGTNGVTVNDTNVLDVDTGANDLQNYPVITRAVSTADGVFVSGRIDTADVATFTLDFYASDAADASGFGEGEQYLTSTTVTTDTNGHGNFRVRLAAASLGEFISATATDAAGNTSEFGQSVEVVPSTASIWVSFDGNVEAPNHGLEGTLESEVFELGDPNLSLGNPEAGTDNGTFAQLFDIADFISAGINDVYGLHHVTADIDIAPTGTTPISLLAGDVLLAVEADGVLTNADLSTTAVTREDMILFRPTMLGDYSSGTFSVVLEQFTDAPVRSLSLVESDTVVGDTTLSRGSILFSQNNGSTRQEEAIYVFTPTDAGVNTAGTFELLIDGLEVTSQIDKRISGLELIESATTIGGASLSTGQILVTTANNTNVGQNLQAVQEGDIFVLTVTETSIDGDSDGQPSTATATLLFDGSDAEISGGQEGIEAIALIAEPTNISPTISTPGAAVSYTENDPATVIDATATVTDADSANLDTGTLTVEFSANGSGNDRLAILNEGTGAGQVGVSGSNVTYEGAVIGTFAGGTNGGTPLVVTFNANATPTNAQELMRHVTYENVSDAPSTLSRTVRFVLADGDGGVSNAATQTVNVTAQNDNPVVTLPGAAVNYTENDPATIVDATATVTDVDSADFDGGSLQAGFAGATGTANDTLAIRNQGTGAGQIGVSGSNVAYEGTIIGTFSGGTGGSQLMVSLNASATPTAVQALARNITYENSSDNPDTTTRLVRIDVMDGDGGDSANVNQSIDFTAVNDAPVLDLNGSDGGGVNYSTLFTEGDAPVNVTDTDATLSDADHTTYQSLSVALGGFVDGNPEKVIVDTETFSFGTVRSRVVTIGTTDFDVTFDGASFTITNNAGGDMPEADLQSLIRSITYEHRDNNPTTGNRTLTFTPTDGDGLAGTAAVTTISIGAVNNAPTLTLPGAALNYAENDPATVIDATATADDVDSADLDTGNLTVDFTANGTANDRLAIRNQGTGAGQIGVSGSTVTYEGFTIGTFAGGTDGSTPLVVTLNANATPTAAQALARNITYQNVATDPDTDTRTVRFVLTDGDGETSAAATQTINLSGDNILVVTTTSDTADGTTTSIDALLADRGADGLISLREAILATNNTANGGTADEIHFDIGLSDAGHFYYQDNAAAGFAAPVSTTLTDASITDFDADYPAATARSWYTIALATALPTVTDAVVIDGSTQTGYLTGLPVIELNGSAIGGSVDGITLATDGATVRGLVINQFSEDGIEVTGDNNLIAGNFIGTDVSGTLDRGITFYGISVDGASSSNTIGGTTLADRNVISGNDSYGIEIGDPGTANNIVIGNFIGTDVTGTAALGNTTAGVYIENSSTGNRIGGTNPGEGNVISGNAGSGILITGSSTTGNIVQGNYIGTNAAGTAALGNAAHGIHVRAGSTNTLIGGLTATARNVISANAIDGIFVSDAGTSNNTIQGNYIGTDITGTTGLGNLDDGISFQNSASNNTVGGSAAGAGNVISDNQDAGLRVASGASTTTILGNYIGTDRTGTANLGNVNSNVRLADSTDNIVGGTGVGEGNVLAYSQNHDGIEVIGTSSGNLLVGNSIFSNFERGIDLGADGVTANDVGDTDAGPNNLQNYPVLTTAVTNGTTVTIDGTLNGAAGTTFALHFYASATGDSSGHGEADRYLGTVSVTTDGSGNVAFSEAITTVVSAGEFITATATDPAGNTSEFAMNVVATPPNSEPTITLPSAALTYTENDPATAIDAAATASDADSADFDTGSLTIDFTANGTANDRLAIRNQGSGAGQIGVSGSDVTYEGTTIGTFTGGTSGSEPLIITFSANSTPTSAQALMRNITFENVSEDPATAARTVRFVLTDGDGGTSTPATQTVNVTSVNDSPVITSNGSGASAVVNVAENTTAVTTVTSSDVDGGVPVYSLSGGADIAEFEIDSATGELTFVSAPNFESPTDDNSDNVYEVTVRVSDGSLTDTQSISVTVTEIDEFDVTAPADADATADAVNENAANSTPVGITASATDADAINSNVMYSLVDDAGGRFTIDSNSGIVTVADGSLLDREAAASHDITVRATSDDGSTADTTFTIAINDLDEFDVTAPADVDATDNAVDENAANDTLVGITASAADADATTSGITYSLFDDAGGRFKIDGSTGVVAVADGTLLDREADASHDITVRATSDDGSTADTTFTIAINDLDEFDVTAPADVDATDNAVDENAATDTLVGITASAADADATTNGITYSLFDDAGGRFKIDGSTGVVAVADGTLLDREADASHDITIGATSDDGSTADTVFTITINDLNDTAPVINPGQSFSVSEFAANGAFLGSATATDADTVGSIQGWAITSGNADGVFEIDAASGEIRVVDNTLLNFETTANYVLGLTVEDGVNTSAAQTVSVSVVDENDIPVLVTNLGTSVTEGASVTISASELAVTDEDELPNQILYSVVNIPIAGQLELSTAPGVVISSFTQADIDAGLLHYIHDGSELDDSFTFSVSDGSGGAIAPTAFSITNLRVNDAPVNAVPAAQTVSEDSPLVFSSAGGNSISVSDADLNGGMLGVRLVATNGVLTLKSTTGLTFASGDGTSDLSMVFAGTVADVNAALDGLRFDPTADYNGPASVRIVSRDMGNTGSGGEQIDDDTVDITVSAENDAPVSVDDAYTVDQLGVLTPGAADGVLVNDLDVEADELQAVLVNGPQNGVLVLNADGSFTYTPAGAFSGEDSFTYRAVDGFADGSVATVRITVRQTVTSGPGANEDQGDTAVVEEPDAPAVETETSSTVVVTVADPVNQTSDSSDEDEVTGVLAFTNASAASETTENSTGNDAQNDVDDDFGDAADDDRSTYGASFRGDDGDELRDRQSGRIVEDAGAAVFTSTDVGSMVYALEQTGFWTELDSFQQDVKNSILEEGEWEALVVETTTVAGTTLTVGYILWLLRSGSVLFGIVSSLPAWTMMDPLPVLQSGLESLGDGSGTDDDDSLQDILQAHHDGFASSAETFEN